MKSKKVILKLAALINAPLFTSQEAKKLGVSSALLAYYVKTGDIERIARGVYRDIHAPTLDNFQWEDLITAIKQTKQGIICLVSALALYELTDEIPRQHWIAIANSTRHRANASIHVVRMRNVTLGKTTIKIDNIVLPIFDRERTIVDAFRFLSIEVAIKALRQGLTKSKKEKINLEKLLRYAAELRVNITPYIMALTI